MQKLLFILAAIFIAVTAAPKFSFAEENISEGARYRLKDFQSFFRESGPDDTVRFIPCGKYFWTAKSTHGETTFFVGELDDSHALNKSSKKMFIGGNRGEKVPLAINNNLREPLVILETNVENPRYTLWMNIREYLNSPCLIRGNQI